MAFFCILQEIEYNTPQESVEATCFVTVIMTGRELAFDSNYFV